MRVAGHAYIAKAVATLAAAAVCSMMLWQTKGEHGVGWFIVALILIW